MPENALATGLKERLLRALTDNYITTPVTAAATLGYGIASNPEQRNALWEAAKNAAGWFAPAGIEYGVERAAAQTITPWYSALRKYAEAKLPNVIEGQQAKNTLRKGSTADEWAKSELENKLQPGQKYTKNELLAHIDERTPEFKDVMLSTGRPPSAVPESMQSIREERNALSVIRRQRYFTPEEESRYDALSVQLEPYYAIDRANKPFSAPKFSTYVEPGGKNYKEMFVTAPDPVGSETLSVAKRINALNQKLRQKYGNITGRWPAGDPEVQELRNLSGGFADRQMGMSWRDGHPDYSDIENPIVRLRFNDRVDAQGKKVLFLEEMQPPSETEQAKMPEELRKRWREIGMKRAIKYAVDNGYDRVAWTTGEMQSARYDLSKVVNRIEATKIDRGGLPGEQNYWVEVFDKNDNRVRAVPRDLTRTQLNEYFGKEVAERLASMTERIGGKREISGLGLKVGGEGLKRIYDQDLPNVARKLGGKIGTMQIETEGAIYRLRDQDTGQILQEYDGTHTYESLVDAEQALRNYTEEGISARILPGESRGKTTNVPSIDIAPFREAASKGFPIYEMTPIGIGTALAGKYLAAREKER